MFFFLGLTNMLSAIVDAEPCKDTALLLWGYLGHEAGDKAANQQGNYMIV